MGGDGLALTEEAGERLRIRARQGVLEHRLHQLRVLVVGRRGEQPEAERSQHRLAAERHPHLAPRGVQRAHVSVRTGERATQVERAHPPGVRERHLLRDHAAHRHADHVPALDAEGVHQPERVAGHHRDRVGAVGRVRLARAPVVEGDHPMVLGEGAHLQAPGGVIAAEAHDEHERLARARLHVVHLDVAHPHPGHATPQIGRGSRGDGRSRRGAGVATARVPAPCFNGSRRPCAPGRRPSAPARPP